MNNNILSLFSGAGGLDLGFEKAGFEVLHAIEFDKNAAETYKHNFKSNVIVDDVNNVDDNFFKELKGKVKGVIGGPPCQGFSLAGKMARNFIDDPRNYLFKRFLEIINIIEPDFVLIENVANMMKHKKGETVEEIEDFLKSKGYKVSFNVLNSSDYGIPQHRRRFFLIATKKNKFEFPSIIKQNRNLADAISDLPKIESGESSKIPNHVAMNHTSQMLDKMSFVKEGGNRESIPESIRPKSGDARKYIRLNREEPSYCVTGDMRKVFHYEQNRALTVRELARVQTFPDNFVFLGPSISQQQQVGNSVPVDLAYLLAKSIREVL